MSIIASILGKIIKPINQVGNLIDKISTTEEEKLGLKNELFKLQSQLTARVIEYESTLVESKRDIIVAEAESSSWLTQSWRPMVMLSFAFIILIETLGQFFGITIKISESLYSIIQIGLGGYVVGRSGEKMMKTYTKSKEKSGDFNNFDGSIG